MSTKSHEKALRNAKVKIVGPDPIYWIGDLGPIDDFGIPYDKIMIDGRTTSGPWANMTALSWRLHGVGRLGTGYGQKYEKQPDGRWLKIEG